MATKCNLPTIPRLVRTYSCWRNLEAWTPLASAPPIGTHTRRLPRDASASQTADALGPGLQTGLPTSDALSDIFVGCATSCVKVPPSICRDCSYTVLGADTPQGQLSNAIFHCNMAKIAGYQLQDDVEIVPLQPGGASPKRVAPCVQRGMLRPGLLKFIAHLRTIGATIIVRPHLAESASKVILQKSIPAQIRPDSFTQLSRDARQ